MPGQARSSRPRTKLGREDAAAGADPGRSAGAPPTAPALSVLRLQRSIGNRGVSDLLDTARKTGRFPAPAPVDRPPREVPTAQRDVTVSWAAVNETRIQGAQAEKSFKNLLEAVRDYHNNKRNGLAVTKQLTDIVTYGRKFLAAQPQTAADRADVKIVATLLNEAETDLKEPLTPPPAAPAAVLKATLGVAPGELKPRLEWMIGVATASDASAAEKAALPKVRKALEEYKVIYARQQASLRTQRGPSSGGARLARPTGDAGALSQLLQELFATFGAKPHGFGTPDAVQRFGLAVKTALQALTITGAGGTSYSGFTDVEVILSGSAVTGRALVAKGGAREPKLFGAHSDFDVAVVSPMLFKACQNVAPTSIRDDNLRTEPDPLPGIVAISRALEKIARREVSIMVFKTRAAAQRSPGVRIA